MYKSGVHFEGMKKSRKAVETRHYERPGGNTAEDVAPRAIGDPGLKGQVEQLGSLY